MLSFRFEKSSVVMNSPRYHSVINRSVWFYNFLSSLSSVFSRSLFCRFFIVFFRLLFFILIHFLFSSYPSERANCFFFVFAFLLLFLLYDFDRLRFDLNTFRLRFWFLGQVDCQNTIVSLRANLILVNLSGQRYAPIE